MSFLLRLIRYIFGRFAGRVFAMNRHLFSACVLAGALGLLSGCASKTPTPLPQFEVNQDKLKATPPAPVNHALKSSDVVPDPVKIQPETSVGYQNLPTTVTAIFNGPVHDLSIGEVVSETLGNNRQIKVEGYNLRLAEYQVPISKSIYDLLVTSRLQYNRIEEQTSAVGFGAQDVNRSRQRSGQIGLGQLLPTGATVDLAYSANRNAYDTLATRPLAVPPFFTLGRTGVTDYQNRTALSVTQPLLQGAGPTVTNAEIMIAQYGQQGAAADFQAQVENQLQRTLQTYWELIGAIENYKVQVISYSAARDLLRVNTAKYQAGVVPRTEVLQAEAAAEARREQLIQARQAVRDLEDQLKRLLFLQEGTPLWTVQIRPTQAIAWREIDVDLDKAIAEAYENRAELRRAQSNISQTGVNLRVARNDLLPTVNLFGQVDTNGLDDTFSGSFDTMSEGNDFNNYSAGVEFAYPLQNRAARYRYKQAQARDEQATELLRDTQDQVTLDVRQAVRDLRTARERINVTQSQVRAAEATLAAENKRLAVGLSTSFEVLQFQEDVASAQAQHIRAVVDYNRAAVRLEKARGTILPTHGVKVTGTDLTPAVKPVKFPVGWN